MAEEPTTDVQTEEVTPQPEPSTGHESAPAAERDYKAEYENLQKALDAERKEKKKYQEYVASLQQPSQQPLQASDDGYIDPEQLLSLAEQRAYERMQNVAAQEKQYQKALKAHPDLEDDPVAMRAIKGIQREALLEGELLSFDQAADAFYGTVDKRTGKARDEAREEATVSERIQARAGIDAPGKSSGKDLVTRYREGKLTKDEIKENWSKIVAATQNN